MDFFGSKFRLAVLLIVLFELISFLCFGLHGFYNFSAVVFVLLCLGMVMLSAWKPEIAILGVLAELFICGKGHFFDFSVGGQTVAIRIGLFCAFFLGFGIWMIRKKKWREVFEAAFSRKSLIILGIICVWGLFTAWVNHPEFNKIFWDFNAWIYFLYFIPLAVIFKDKNNLQALVQVLAAAVVWISIKTLFYFYAFTHSLPIIVDLYKWGRDTGWGEFTLVSGNLFRIFSQSQLYAMIGLGVFGVAFALKQKIEWKKDWPMIATAVLSCAAVLISLSRSFWVGCAVAAGVVFIVALWKLKYKFKELLFAGIKMSGVAVLAYAVTLGVLYFPIPWIERGSADLLSNRLKLEAAASSRQQQLGPLSREIAVHPILGSGWGTEVTYFSNDPRIKNAKNPTGEYTTAAFEWGYLDILLKIGLIGLVAYGWVVFAAGKNVWGKMMKAEQGERLLYLGLFAGLFALLATHMFSPYLNHPLGIGYIVLLIVL
jgi:O-antigen ligase